MKNISKDYSSVQYAAAGKRGYAAHYSFTKKNNIIRNIEIIVACVIAVIAGTGLYELFQ
jgi:hypothetical protein